ncbi:RHS domain-containing protein, partial [Erwinia billingiae]|uniref:RHS domain-containing protein n=1 Tax=Erwinia billingiae TaxID=182337 RepID=UPI0022460DC9
MTWRKTGPDAVEQHYRYDDEQRIAEVCFSGHKEFSRAEYRYDALGRRTHKILHRHHKPEETISFLWSGLRMVGESNSLTPDRNTQCLYSEGSWEPLARVDSIGEQADIFWYHTELNGLPERMTNEEGEVVWRGRFSTWGMTGQESSSG